MKSRQGRSLIITALVTALAGVAPRMARADVTKGAQLYKTRQCSMCHKVNGSGGKKGPDLSAVGGTRDAAWLQKYLLNPKSMIPKGSMPPAKASPAELKDLVDYLETLKGGK